METALEYIQNNLWIRTKDKRLVRLEPKPAQMVIYNAIKEEHEAGRPVRLIILKARQLGASTVTEAVMFQDSARFQLVKTLIVAHADTSTKNLFEMNKLFYDRLPPRRQPMRKRSNAKEIVFENPTKDKKKKRKRPGLMSSVKCVTAGSKGAGRSDTLSNVHLSELAFWPGDPEATYIGIMQAVPDEPDTCVVVESTPNGYNYFKKLWDEAVSGENGLKPIFLAWFTDPDYRREVEPGTVWDEYELRLKKRFNLDDEQLAWRRWQIKVNCGNNEKMFRQEYPSTPEEAFLTSGDPFFDNDAIAEWLEQLDPWIREGEFTYDPPESKGEKPRNIGWHNKEHGIVRIYEEPKPGHYYVLGGDTAGDGSDYFTAYVIDNLTKKCVADYRCQYSEIYYARQMWCLGRYFNWALIALEINYSTYPAKKLSEWNYPRLYQRERKDTSFKQMVKALGWATTSKTRPVMLANLHTITEDELGIIRSHRVLREMLRFVYDKNRRPEAAEGEHDDMVMGCAICYEAASQQQGGLTETHGSRDHWTDDMWEDYYSADEAGKRHLEEMWEQ